MNKSAQSPEEQDTQNESVLGQIGPALSDFLEKNEYVLPGLVAGALLGGGSSLFNPRSSFLNNVLLGGLLGGGAGYGAPYLSKLFQRKQEPPEGPRPEGPRPEGPRGYETEKEPQIIEQQIQPAPGPRAYE